MQAGMAALSYRSLLTAPARFRTGLYTYTAYSRTSSSYRIIDCLRVNAITRSIFVISFPFWSFPQGRQNFIRLNATTRSKIVIASCPGHYRLCMCARICFSGNILASLISFHGLLAEIPMKICSHLLILTCLVNFSVMRKCS